MLGKTCYHCCKPVKSYLKVNFYPVYKEENDDDEQKDSVASVEDVEIVVLQSVRVNKRNALEQYDKVGPYLFSFIRVCQNKKQLCQQNWVCDNIERDKAQERLWKKTVWLEAHISHMEYLQNEWTMKDKQ